MQSPLPATGTAKLLEALSPYVPDEFINRLLPGTRRQGHRNYFSAAQLRSLFAACSLGELPLAGVYTSSDHGTGKGDELWKVVVEDLRIEPDELVHLGDNLEADVSCAQRVGVRAVHYPMSTDRYLAIDIRERVVGQPGDASTWCN